MLPSPKKNFLIRFYVIFTYFVCLLHNPKIYETICYCVQMGATSVLLEGDFNFRDTSTRQNLTPSQFILTRSSWKITRQAQGW